MSAHAAARASGGAAEPRTILYVHSSDEMYGADRVLLQLVSHLDRQQFRPVVILPTDLPYTGSLSHALQAQGIKTLHLDLAVLRRRHLTPLGIGRYAWRLAKSTLQVARIASAESAALIHSNTLAVLPGALAARLARRPHLWHVHEIITAPRWLWRATSWLAPRLSSSVVAVSGPTRDHLLAGDGRNAGKAIVIHNGIDPGRFQPGSGLGQAVRRQWGVRPDEPLIGMVGRVSHWKGQEYLLQVAARVLQAHPQARFVLVGGTVPGEEAKTEELSRLVARLHLSEAAIIEGFRTDIEAVMDALDVFVLPSVRPDPLPTVVLEAMAAARPVVANAHGGSIEMVEEGVTGFLVPPDRPEEMAAAIGRLIAQPELRRLMGQRGRSRVQALFSPDAQIRAFTRLYEQLCLPAATQDIRRP